MDRRSFVRGVAALGGVAALPAFPGIVRAQSRGDTLLVVVESCPIHLDVHSSIVSVPTFGVAWNIYDRLLSYEWREMPNGVLHYDSTKLAPALAESWQVASDGMSATFNLRRDAVFHDGSPVTAHDVKYSYDRAVSVGGFPTFQFKAGSLERREQFGVVDDHTFRIDFVRKDKLTLPDLAVPVAMILNSKLMKKHATKDDPWSMEWLKTNTAGGGPYKVADWRPKRQMVYERFDGWKLGSKPALKRILMREVPSPGNRRALLERRDADVSFDLPPKDFAELDKAKEVDVYGVPAENAMWFLALNCVNPPFKDRRIRQAVAWAMPYEKILDVAFYRRGLPLYGAGGPPAEPVWPQPTWYSTDLDKARALMAEAGAADGFDTVIAFEQARAQVSEPIAVLTQEALRAIGIRAELRRISGAQWRGEQAKKYLPIMVDRFGGWLNFPDYYFFWAYHGQNSLFNLSSYQNPEMDKLIDASRFEPDPAKYREQVIGFTRILFEDVPQIPLVQHFTDVAMQRNVSGYRFWFHRELDYRYFEKSV